MTETAPKSKKGLLIGGAVAVLAAVGVVGFVLPAEFGIDPTGIGKATGVLKMSDTEDTNIYLERGLARTGVMFPLDAPVPVDAQPAKLAEVLAANGLPAVPAAAMKSDRFTFELLPYEGIELKYELNAGSPIVFTWQGTGPLDYDQHGHPYEGGEELTESYSITKAPTQSAVYVAPFTGIHGWYWQNRTLEPVTLTLDATGAIVKSYTFDRAGQHDRELTPPVPGDTAAEATAGATPEPSGTAAP